MKEPLLHIGILFEPRIEFIFHTSYRLNGNEIVGKQTVNFDNGKILWSGRHYDELLFEPVQSESSVFEILDVTIGINFHWERKEDQRFQGSFKVIVEDDKLTGINILPVEDYLTSVISSEMSATASLELLKAHAVISRSWLLAGMNHNDNLSPNPSPKVKENNQHAAEYGDCKNNREFIRWYERDAHTHFHVCADDHCQRYQGITKASTDAVKQAVSSTKGQVLTYKGDICDARFSKCCGGVFEEFQNCWEDKKIPYLQKKRDIIDQTDTPDLTIEKEADKWIRTSPESFCNTHDSSVLTQVLNNYDQETTHFYRWKVEYSQKELSELIQDRSGIDFGDILQLIPAERGTSGRLIKLKIIGSKDTLTIGKELEIRRTLSPSHLYSSAFVIDTETGMNGIPEIFILTGAGWGHGVGLCQIGAAVMGEKGYPYKEILLHYFIDAQIEKLY